MTTHGILNDNTNIHNEEPSVFIHDKLDAPKEVLIEMNLRKPKNKLFKHQLRLEEACTVMINERCSTVLLNRLPSKEKDLGSFSISCNIGNLHINNVLADLGASIGLMPYTMYEKLDDLDETIDVETHELLGSDQLDSLLLKGLEKSNNQANLESCDSIGDESGNNYDLGTPIRHINPINTPYSVAHEIIRFDGIESEHLYSTSANEIDGKKPKLKDLPRHLEYAYLHGDKSFPIILSSNLSKTEKMLLLQDSSKFQSHPKIKRGRKLSCKSLIRIKNPDLGVFIEEEIIDEFSNEHLMMLKAKPNNDDPWYADYVNYIVGKIVPQDGHQKKEGFSLNKILEILAHYHYGPTGGHHSASIIERKRPRNLSSRSEMPQNNIQVCDVFDICGLDFMGPFSNSRGNKYILVAINYVSKWVEAQELPTNDARVVIKFVRGFFARFGVLKALISERGTHFCSFQLEKALRKNRVTHKLSTTYHPQTNGQTEVTNRAIKIILERSVGYNLKDWSEKLNDALWAFRLPTKQLWDVHL
nr:reverse transcriptase domain-containing protein [Tanacetum cinerariifolium]